MFCEELCMSCYTCVYLNICTLKKKKKKNYNDANVSFTRFQEITNNNVSKCFPEKTTKIKYENKYPWMTQSLRKCIREKNQLSSMVILNPTNEQLKSQYKSLRNSVTSKLRNAEL